MSEEARVVFFDVDGVLVDSLPQHLQVCRDLARQFGLDLEIPGVDRFREKVSGGTRVSPMSEFFRAVGFPESHVEKAVAEYERDFAARYKPQKFVGVDEMLMRLSKAGVRLGLVTSNTSANVKPALGGAMQCFEPGAVFFFGSPDAPGGKAECLAQGVRTLGADVGASVYVGDQPADAEAATSAGVKFLGVTYGWGILPDQSKFETVNTVEELAERLAGANVQGGAMAQTDWNLETLKLRLDYGWKWFSFHADQRTKMFNFMLVVVGIFATAVVGTYKEGMIDLAISLCIATGIFALIFVLLDRRNQYLVELGEDVLRRLESQKIFDGIEKGMNGRGEDVTFGLLLRQATEPERRVWNFFNDGGLRKDRIRKYVKDAALGKHRIWLRLVALLIAGLFFCGAIFLACSETSAARRTVQLLTPFGPAGTMEFGRGWRALEASPPFGLGATAFDTADVECTLPEAMASAQKWIDAVVRQWKERKDPSSGGFILIGSADRIPLNDRLRQAGGSNVGLARGRAETVKDMLVAATKDEAPANRIAAEHVMVLVTGPRYWADPRPGAKREPEVCNDPELRADRTVQVWIYGGS